MITGLIEMEKTPMTTKRASVNRETIPTGIEAIRT